MQSETVRPPLLSPLRRALFAGSGLVCVGLGVLGIALPGLPTTPFLLAASYLFARSSPRLSAWLSEHRWLGRYVRAVRDERAMPRGAKVVTLVVLWVTVALSLWMLSHSGLLGYATGSALIGIAATVTWYVGWRLGTASPVRPPDGSTDLS